MNLTMYLFCNEDGKCPDYVTAEHDGATVMLTTVEHKLINGRTEQVKSCAFMLPNEARMLADILLREADDCQA